MRWPFGGTNAGEWAGDMRRWLVELATDRDEVDQEVTARAATYKAVLYGGLFLVCLVAGGLLWLDGRRGLALTLWVVGDGLAIFFGTIAVGWDLLELFGERRAAGSSPAEPPRRELAPRFALSRDAKISFLLAVVLVLIIAAAVHLVAAIA